MDDNIYIVNLTWTLPNGYNIPKDTSFPKFGLILDPPKGLESVADGWSALIQIFEVLPNGETNAYLRLVAWNLFPRKMVIGEKLVFRRGKNTLAHGEITGIVNDQRLRQELLNWSLVKK